MTKNKLKILFVSRAYPPIVGGIENQNYDLGEWLGRIAEVKIVANKYGRKFLPIFAPYALFYAIWNIKKFDVILLGDGVLAFIAWSIKFFSRLPIVCVAHGLDINYASASLGVWYEKFLVFIYQKLWVKNFLPKIDRFIAVGNETRHVLESINILSEKIVFIPNGIDPNNYQENFVRADLEKVLGENLQNKKVLMTSGRLARRKGVAWFVLNVMPKLPENIIYVILGDGPDKKNVMDAIQKTGLENRIRLIGRKSNSVRDMLFHTCDIFVQPNIKIPGDMEGFGISVIEAVYAGIPVIAARLEGLKDAIKDGQNGFLIETEDAESYIQKITDLLNDDAYRKSFGQQARQYILDNLTWEKISKKYLTEIERVVKN